MTILAAGPAAAQAMTVEQRQRTYRQVLADTAESVAGAPGDPYLVMLSSLSVYGDAANHLDVIDESAPLTTDDDPSPAMFQQAERTYRAAMSQVIEQDDLREILARQELYRRLTRISDAVVGVADRVMYATVREG